MLEEKVLSFLFLFWACGTDKKQWENKFEWIDNCKQTLRKLYIGLGIIMIDVLKEISGAVLFDEQILMKFFGKQKLCKFNKTTGVKKQTQP